MVVATAAVIIAGCYSPCNCCTVLFLNAAAVGLWVGRCQDDHNTIIVAAVLS